MTMAIKTIRDILIPFVTVIGILTVSAAIIAYGRGYRLDAIGKTVKPTGLIAATSDPTGAQVLVDGKLKNATNSTINVNPGWYKVSVAKEGYQTWEKNLRVQGEVVTRADAYLFPVSPSLSAMTTSGIRVPVLSPDGAKLAYIIPDQVATDSSQLTNRAGVWALDLTDRPLGLNRDARQITKSTFPDYSEAVLTWSPDSKELVAAVPNPATKLISYYRLDASKLNEFPERIADPATIEAEWKELAATKEAEKLSVLRKEAEDALKPIMNVLSFSPDESKILYEATASATIPQIVTPPLIGTNPTEEARSVKMHSIYVYDIKEDRNYLIGDKATLRFTDPTPTPTAKKGLTPTVRSPYDTYTSPLPVQWLPTSRHLILTSKDRIEAMDYDATNRKTLYAGPFWDSFVVPWSNASKLLILTTLNPLASVLPNLYAVNLR
jgi:hypothetical protein